MRVFRLPLGIYLSLRSLLLSSSLNILMFPLDRHSICLSNFSPIPYFVKISTLVYGCEVSQIDVQLRIVLECVWRQIPMAHNDLSKIINAVFSVDVSLDTCITKVLVITEVLLPLRLVPLLYRTSFKLP